MIKGGVGLFTMIAVLLLALLGTSYASLPALVPLPQEIRPLSGLVELDRPWNIAVDSGSPADTLAALSLLKEAKAAGLRWRMSRNSASHTIHIQSGVLDWARESLQRSQGYELVATPHNIELTAQTEAGRYYAVQTLRQLVRAGGTRLASVKIVDWPSLKMRGVSDDISRGQMSTVADFQEIIARLGYYKLNTYALYIEDAFRFRAYPEIGAQRAQLTGDDISILRASAKEHHVELIPIIETLGHQGRLLAIPELSQHSEMAATKSERLLAHTAFAAASNASAITGPMSLGLANLALWLWKEAIPLAERRSESLEMGSTLCASCPETREFVATLVDEIHGAFAPSMLHIGGDEAFEIGKGRSQKRASQIGVGGVYGEYIAYLLEHVRNEYGTAGMLYSDMMLKHRSAMNYVDHETVIVHWDHQPDSDFAAVDTLIAEGFPQIIVAPGLWNWRSFYPNYGRAFPNIASAAAKAKSANIMGTIVSSWGDSGSESLRENNWAGYAYSADCSWSEGESESQGFLQRFTRTHYGTDHGLPEVERALGWQDFASHGWYGRVFHMAPVVKRRGDVWKGRMNALRKNMLQAQSALARGRKSATAEVEQLDNMSHAIDRFLYVANRELVLGMIGEELLQSRVSGAGAQRASVGIAKLLLGLVTESKTLVGEYEELWLRNNRRRGLAMNLIRLRKQHEELERLAAMARSGTLEAWKPRGALDTEPGKSAN